jgi:hypothetical protein
VTIPRLHLFELEDQPWFPAIIRDLATDYLQFVEAKAALHRPVVPLLADALRASGATRVIDLCAGGGGPVVALRSDLERAGVDVPFVLTDKYPNLPAFSAIAAEHPGISGHPTPVDAAAVPRALTGFRTLFNAFHHFKPTAAKAVLRSAIDARQPIGVFEIPERTIGMVLGRARRPCGKPRGCPLLLDVGQGQGRSLHRPSDVPDRTPALNSRIPEAGRQDGSSTNRCGA